MCIGSSDYLGNRGGGIYVTGCPLLPPSCCGRHQRNNGGCGHSTHCFCFYPKGRKWKRVSVTLRRGYVESLFLTEAVSKQTEDRQERLYTRSFQKIFASPITQTLMSRLLYILFSLGLDVSKRARRITQCKRIGCVTLC